MGIEKVEIWVHDHILKNATIRHFVYGIYQRILYTVSPKINFEGDIQIITPDDGYEYLFGYYDKCPWDDTGRYMLALRVKSATASADSSVPADIVRIDTHNANSVEVIATTNSWNVQQGCMAQWLTSDSIIYNDFRNKRYCAVILNLNSRTERIIEMPIYAMSQDNKTALTLDFARLHRLRPGYGYCNIADSSKEQKCPDEPCIWRINIESGEIVPLLKYTDFANFQTRPEMNGSEHKVNHLMISPDGKRFMVLHRWFKNGEKFTRLVTCNIDGTDMYNLSDDNFVSHCCWKNNDEILSYLNKKEGGKGYYLMKDKTQEYQSKWNELAMDGHPMYSYDGKYVSTDTYPDRRRIQSVYVIENDIVRRVARVFSPFKYKNDVRCDLHPRWSKSGDKLCFDASFSGKRSVCVVNLKKKQKSNLEEIIEENNNPLISIIIPCYNCEALIDETLETLEAQTYKNFEVVCINDGSTDGTLARLKVWQQKGTLNINIMDQPNGGVSNARNNGIAAAKGEYLLFLDSDDVYHKEYVERLYGALVESRADVAYSRLSRRIEEAKGYIPQVEEYQIQNQKQAMDKLLFEMGKYGFYCYIYKKDILVQKQIYFDENTKFGEDREFNWKYLTHCNTAAWIDMPLYGYRINENSATQKSASWRKTDLLTAVKRIENYLDEQYCEYSDTFKSYMYARAMWAVAKTFAVSGDKELFKRLKAEYDVKTCMKRTSKDSSKIVAIASWMYRLHPSLFYNIVRLKK